MGQAALDLPDPLEARPSTGVPAEGAAGADDLLSQLAGDEINRLLAEADMAPPEDEPKPTRAMPPLASNGEIKPSPSLGADLAPSPRTTSSPGIADPDPLASAELDRVFDQMTAVDAAGSPKLGDPAVPGGPLVNAVEADVSSPAAPAADDPDEPALSDLENVLESVVARDAEAAAGDAASSCEKAATGEAAETGPVNRERRVPFYHRVLQWLSVPWAWIPQSILDAVGKVAILTLINAAAVLLYVLIFRRR